MPKKLLTISEWMAADREQVKRDTVIRWLKTGVLRGKLVRSESNQLGRWLVLTPPNKRESTPAKPGRRRNEMAKKIAAKLIDAFVATCETCGKQETEIYESKREERYLLAVRLQRARWIVDQHEALRCDKCSALIS